MARVPQFDHPCTSPNTQVLTNSGCVNLIFSEAEIFKTIKMIAIVIFSNENFENVFKLIRRVKTTIVQPNYY